ncbi:hypothetical protein [Streptomyces sp. NPDC002324]
MTTRTTKTFEDRLLDELQREIALRAEDGPEREPVIRRTITTRRALVALAACVAAGGVVVALPSSSGGAKAYAVERNDDGSITIRTEKKLSYRDRDEMVERLRAEGIYVSIDRPRKGYVCEQPRGETDPPGPKGAFSFTLWPGETLALEGPDMVKDGVRPTGNTYVVKGLVEACREVPHKSAPDRG